MGSLFTVLVLTKNGQLEANTYMSFEADLIMRKLQSQGYEVIEARRFDDLNTAQACKDEFRTMNQDQINEYLK